MAKTPQKRDQKGEVNTSMRPLCVCGQRPAAINYKKGNNSKYLFFKTTQKNKNAAYKFTITYVILFHIVSCMYYISFNFNLCPNFDKYLLLIQILYHRYEI